VSKKPIIGIVVTVAVLTMACICCPTSTFSFSWGPTVVPERPAPVEPTAIPETTVTGLSVPSSAGTPVCEANLAKVLDEAENGYVSSGGPQPNGDVTLVTYTVVGDAISDPVYAQVPSDMVAYQQDTTTQESIWHFITDVIPADQRTMVTNYLIFTDGTSDSLGAVEQAHNPQDWILEMDIIDGTRFPDMSTTVIHEFAHLLTLDQSQVTPDLQVFYNPDDQAIYNQEAAACPTYFIFEGCSHSDSYLNQFFQRFWPNIYDEWKAIDSESDPDLLDQKLSTFYRKYSNRFVSEYAATSPSEDIAETFMYFIFSPKPSGNSISDQKIQFFYEYPELVSLRERIIEKLCPYVNNQ
jgi:hypothetical protein